MKLNEQNGHFTNQLQVIYNEGRLYAVFDVNEDTKTLRLEKIEDLAQIGFCCDNGKIKAELPSAVEYKGTEYTLNSIGSNIGSGVEILIIPNTVTNIDPSAFITYGNLKILKQIVIQNPALLKDVDIPEGVEIATESFQVEDLRLEPDIRITSNLDGRVMEFNVTNNKKGLKLCHMDEMDDIKHLVIPSEVKGIPVTEIGSWAFDNCWDMETISLPPTLKVLEKHALSDTPLKSVFIPENLWTIEGSVLSGCENLVSIEVSKENKFFDSRNNCNAIIDTPNNILINGCATTVIPNTVKAIGAEAFSECTGLKRITIPDSVEKIGKHAFCGCGNLEEIIISDASLLVNASVPEGVTIIEKKNNKSNQ